jgi:hypothetical protein
VHVAELAALAVRVGTVLVLFIGFGAGHWWSWFRRLTHPVPGAPIVRAIVEALDPEIAAVEGTAVRRCQRLIEIVESECPPECVASAELHDWQIAGPALLLRSARALSAMLELRPGGYEADASALLRIVFENVVTFAWLAINPSEHAPLWVKNDFRQRLAAHRDLSSVGDDDVVDAESVAYFESYVAQVRGDLPKPQQLARAADDHWHERLPGHPKFDARGSFSDMYRVTYRHSSKFAHPTPVGLQPFVRRFANGKAVFTREQRTGTNPYAYAPFVYGIGLRVAAVALGWPTLNQIDNAIGGDDA